VTDELRSKAEPVLELDDILRDALSRLLAEEAQYGPVVNERGEVVGVLSIEILAHALRADPEEIPHGADLIA
jgi:CBS-domain-containing membrane protein